jgi:hypothetical protein
MRAAIYIKPKVKLYLTEICLCVCQRLGKTFLMCYFEKQREFSDVGKLRDKNAYTELSLRNLFGIYSMLDVAIQLLAPKKYSLELQDAKVNWQDFRTLR